MKSPKSLETLQLALHGMSAPFCCEGSHTLDAPVTLLFKDQTRFEVKQAKNIHEQPAALQPLVAHCEPAPFGAGNKTRYDLNVRDALQLKAAGGSFTVEHFDPESAGILRQIRRQLLPHDPNPISAELYCVNVYAKGGHFAPHKDTPRGEDMFGTLVVCLPPEFFGGNLVLKHRGIARKFEWGRSMSETETPRLLKWAAFFGDVDHQIERIWGGMRVTLTYLLRRSSGGSTAHENGGQELEPRVQEAWRAALADRTFLPRGGTLAYPCSHLYHQDSRFQQTSVDITPQSATMLKGRDQLAAATAIQSGVKVEFHPYLFEDCVDETWQLNRFPTPAERKKLRKQMSSALLEKALPIREGFESVKKLKVTWLDPPPSSKSTWRRLDDYLSPDSETSAELPAAAHLHSCEYCPWGYFGNEASYVGFYTYAALHFEIPPFGEGIRRPPQIELYPVSEQDQPAPKRAVKKSVGKKAATAKQAPKTKKPSRRKSAD